MRFPIRPRVRRRVVPLPAQPFTLLYGETGDPANQFATSYSTPGGLVIVGRTNYQDAVIQNVSAAGGTVLMYVDPVVDNPYGRYAGLLYNSNAYGPALARWPGNYQVSEWGYLTDFRPGQPVHTKLRSIMELMIAENPHMGGFFVDDLGSRSWFPLLDWNTFPDQQQYRDGAIALCQVARSVCDQYGLMFIVNGTWQAGGLSSGGGYPDANTHGNALADGGFVEHHVIDAFWTNYADAATSQWAEQSTVTDKNPIMLANVLTAGELDGFNNSGVYSYTAIQASADYSGVAPWNTGAFHYTGLPSRVGG